MKKQALVDQIGKLSAHIATLNTELEALKDEAKSRYGEGQHFGRRYKIVISFSDRACVNWNAIVEKAHVSERLIKANTKYTPSTTLKCYAHSVDDRVAA